MARTGALAGCGALLVSEPSSWRRCWRRRGRCGCASSPTGGSATARATPAPWAAAASAIERMLDALAGLRGFAFEADDHPLLGGPTLNIGTIRGGTTVNLTPDRCEAEIDIRTLPGMAPEAVESAVQACVGADIDIERIDCKPPVETPADHPFARLCLEAVGAARGVRAEPGGAAYYSDAAVLTPAFGLPMVIIGPGALGMSGQTDEHVETAAVDAAAEVFERIARARLAA